MALDVTKTTVHAKCPYCGRLVETKGSMLDRGTNILVCDHTEEAQGCGEEFVVTISIAIYATSFPIDFEKPTHAPLWSGT